MFPRHLLRRSGRGMFRDWSPVEFSKIHSITLLEYTSFDPEVRR